MERVLEKEVMDDKENVIEYSTANFKSNEIFVDLFVKEFPFVKNILDMGCGPGDIPIKLIKFMSSVKVTAIDASKLMLEFARKEVKKEGFENKINLIQKDLKGLDLKGLDLKEKFDCIISKDVLHHIPDPFLFWKAIKNLIKEKEVVFVADLIRPDSEEEIKKIVEKEYSSECPILKEDYYNSLKAAFTIEEVCKQLKEVGLNLNVEKLGKRHFLVKGIVNGLDGI